MPTPRHHARLLTVLHERLGHDLLGRAESAKIAVAEGGDTSIDLGHVEARLAVMLSADTAARSLEADVTRIVAAAQATVAQAGLEPSAVDALYFTGGSTGLRLLTRRLAEAFAPARVVRGDRFASVVAGLALHAKRRFASRAPALGRTGKRPTATPP